MKRIEISDIDGLRSAVRICPTLFGCDANLIDWILRNRWHPLDVLAMQHGLDLIDRALCRVLKEAR
jgi:hypothetical protein